MISSNRPIPRSSAANFVSLRALFLPVAYAGTAIDIELSMRRGLPIVKFSGFQNHGQGTDTLERVKTALYRMRERLPNMNIAVNLSPVDIRKSGSYLDLPIFVAFLRLLRPDLQCQLGEASLLFPKMGLRDNFLYIGELSLSGGIKQVPNILPMLHEAKKHNFTHIVLPKGNLSIARLIPNLCYIPITETSDLFQQLNNRFEYGFKKSQPAEDFQKYPMIKMTPYVSKLAGLKYNHILQRALALAAGGWHSSLLIGPPGSGKSSFAREIAALLTLPKQAEVLEILINRSDLSKTNAEKIEVRRPMRAPHHSATRRALIGGGSPLQPGEITMAHHGVLILDELAEFSRDALNALREPLETREVHLAIGKEHVIWPSRFLLCASANPCPCGDIRNRPQCTCTDHTLRQYHRKFMGALKNRIDIIIDIDPEQRNQEFCDEASLRSLVQNAKKMQEQRFEKNSDNEQLRYNSDIPFHSLENMIPFNGTEVKRVWEKIQDFPKFSYRTTASIRKMSRTLADMELREHVSAEDLMLASSFKSMNMMDQN